MDILSTLFSLQSRKIGLLVPDVVIKEDHSDTLEVTLHPVEQGTFISDHAYRTPAELSMTVGFAGGGSLLDFSDTTAVGLSRGLSPREIYDELLTLQRSRQPFEVITGKRLYASMMMTSLTVTTDKTSENVLSATLKLREVLITATQSISVAEKTDMREGVSTSAVKRSGVKSVKPAKNALLPDVKAALGRD